MFRLRGSVGSVGLCLRRLFHGSAVRRDQVLEQLWGCSAEDHVFDVVGKNKAKLSVDHVSFAVSMLWQLQREKPQLLRTVELIKAHPEFLTLRVLAENKISLMDDFILVDTLYSFLRLNVAHHDSLIQQLLSEAWLRVDSLPLKPLSKFAMCLNDLQLQHSPLMGHIAHIVDQRLLSIDDARILTTLMTSVSSLLSVRLRDALIGRADHLLDTMDLSDYSNARRVVQFLRNIKYSHQPLLEKCKQILLSNISRLDAENISIVMGLFQSLQFNNCDFRLAVKQRLVELIDSSTDPVSFAKLLVALAPMASSEIRAGLENTALLLADEFTPQQAMAVAEALEETQSRNISLRNKIASVIQKNLHVYRPVEVSRVTQALYQLRYQNRELFAELRNILLHFLQKSISPHEVTMLVRVLSMLSSSRLDDSMISRVNAVAPQCNLSDLDTIAYCVAKWMRYDPAYSHSAPGRYVGLLQTLTRCGQERLRRADRLDLLLEDLRHSSGEWFEEMLMEETVATLQRMSQQINYSNVPDLAAFLTRFNHLCPPLMERIADVTVKDNHKIHHTAIYAILLPFIILNYDPVGADDLYEACIQRFTPHISSFDPHMLVLLASSLSMANCFPEELVREIFTVDFLGRLDSQLETLPESLNWRTRQRLMELNRAVCIECPEFQVPWFHERYCQQLHKRGYGSSSPVQNQIHKMLGEVLGGMNYIQVAVTTPYFYTVDFECILDKHLKPLAFMEPGTLQISNRGNFNGSTENIRSELPPGAQRVAVNFLDSRSFCKNSHHIKGEPLMWKRHLEILGYRVVQIPHFEWNSMELSTDEAWKEYLKKKIFKEHSP